MKRIVLVLFAVLLIAPITTAGVNSGATVEPLDFFATVTPEFLTMTNSSLGATSFGFMDFTTTSFGDTCFERCARQHSACSTAICGQPCFVEPCLSEATACFVACGI